MNFSSEIRKTHGEIMEGQKYLHATGVNFRPRRDELPQVVGTKDRRISVGDFVLGKNVRTFILSYFIVQTKTNSGKSRPSKIVKVVHDDGHKEVDHDEGAEEDEGDKVDVGDVRATTLFGINQLTRGRVPAKEEKHETDERAINVFVKVDVMRSRGNSRIISLSFRQ